MGYVADLESDEVDAIPGGVVTAVAGVGFPDDPLMDCVVDPESDEVDAIPGGGVAVAAASAGSVSGGNCGCRLQIHAMIWRPGQCIAFLSSDESPSSENGPKALAFARAAASLSDHTASITRFLTAIKAVGRKVNGPVLVGPPEA